MPNLGFTNPGKNTQRAKELRKQAPNTERLLWNALKVLRTETGLHFRRQHPVPPYFADFACIKAKLIIELDGASQDARQAYDTVRDVALRKDGWEIIRISNQEILGNLEGVVLMLVDVAQKRSLRTHP